MISIRECVTKADLRKVKDKHISFVSKEVEKRIDFYINLFESINSFSTGTKEITIKNAVNKFIHVKQYNPFIKIIFADQKKFDETKYLNLKKTLLFKAAAQNINLVIEKLKKLKSKYKLIIGLDLSLASQIKLDYYNNLRDIYFEPIDFLLKKIFDYEEWFENIAPDKDWGPYQLTQSLGIKVCSYCNRQYTFSLSKGKNKITRPELDHFLPKNEHPLLALSFFNLIPSCTICNRDCKGKVSFSYIDYFSPYEINPKHELLKFDYIPTSYLGSIGETNEIKVFVKNDGAKLEPGLKNKLDNTSKIFEHNTIINEHKDVVQEIIRKRHISNDSYIQSLQKAFPEAKLTLEEAYRLAYGNFYDEKEFNKRPLAKLTKDIAISIGAIKKSTKK